MKCPSCGQQEDRVLESRSNSTGVSIRRRRECLTCGFRFTSYEQIESTPLMVVKRNNRRELFDQAKIEKGLYHALKKRPVSQLEIHQLIDELVKEMHELGRVRGEVTSSQVGDLIMGKLYEIDKVAYVRFASVYRQFNNTEEFVNIIKEMTEK